MAFLRDKRDAILYAFSVMFVWLIMLTIIGPWWLNLRINNSIDNNNQKFCSVLKPITSPGPDVPSPMPGTRAYEISRQLNKLQKDYKCR